MKAQMPTPTDLMKDCVFWIRFDSDEEHWVGTVDKFPDVKVFEFGPDLALFQLLLVVMDLRGIPNGTYEHVCDQHGPYDLTLAEMKRGEPCPTCAEDESYCKAAEAARFPQVNHWFNELWNRLP